MRISTIKRNNSIHLMYKNIMNDLGQLRTVVSESHKRTGYRFFVKGIHFPTFVCSLVFRFKFFMVLV